MQVRKLLHDDDAVSPVIGVILMVAITVILAAVIASFVLGLGGGQQQTPTASFSWDYEQTAQASSSNYNFGIITLSHDGGDSIKATQLYVRGGKFASNGEIDPSSGPNHKADMYEGGVSTKTWYKAGGTATGKIGDTSAVQAGNELTIAAQSNFDFSLVWQPQSGDTSATLTQKTGPDA